MRYDPATGLAGLVLIAALSGCVSSKYQTVHGGPQLPRNLALSGRNLSTEAKVDTVIIRGGPGSWKHEAWWDEYVVSITNHGTTALAIEAVTLTSSPGRIAVPGTDPWRLENESKTLCAHLRTSESDVSAALITTSAVTLEVTNFVLGVVSLQPEPPLPIGTFMGASKVAKTDLAATDARNATAIAAEFNRRRLVLPVRLAPGETRRGSLFFPVTPGPKALELRCDLGARPHAVTVELTAISSLHLGPRPAEEPEPVGTPLAPLALASTGR